MTSAPLHGRETVTPLLHSRSTTVPQLLHHSYTTVTQLSHITPLQSFECRRRYTVAERREHLLLQREATEVAQRCRHVALKSRDGRQTLLVSKGISTATAQLGWQRWPPRTVLVQPQLPLVQLRQALGGESAIGASGLPSERIWMHTRVTRLEAPP